MENTTDNTKPPSKKPRLITACEGGNYRIAKTIIQRGDDVNVRDARGKTPLIVTCVSGNAEVVELLLSHGADVNTQDTKRWSSLMAASQHGHNDVVKTLLDKGAQVNMQKYNGWSSLMLASHFGHNDVVKTLLDKGAEVNMQNNEGSTSLMSASQDGHNDVVKTLLDKGAEVNMQDNHGWTSLMYASKKGDSDVVKTLLDKGAEVNMQVKDGASSLMAANLHADNDVEKMLLSLFKSAAMNMPTNLHADNDVEKMLLSLFESAAINMSTIDGWTSLMFASWFGHSDTLKVLLENHADITIRSAAGDTALDIALLREQVDIVELLADAEQDSPLADLAQPLESIIHSTSQTDEQGKDVTTPDTISQGALDDGELSPAHNQDEESRDPPKHSSEPHTLGASNIIPEDCETNKLDNSHQDKTTATATADHIGTAIGIDPKQLDQPCSEDLLLTIARLLPNWMEYADPLKMTPQEINGINTDLNLTYAMKSRELLRTWYRKNAYTDQCHYRVLVEASCDLGYANVAGKICKLIKASTATQSSTPEDSLTERISRDLVLFKKEAIGGGAFGTVFRGEINGQPCALKILHSLAGEIQLSLPIAGQAKQDSVVRFQTECEYLESFKHPNVVRHRATRTHPKTGHLVLALELMDCNLKQFFSSPSGKDLPFRTQKSLCRDIASALAYIHSRHIVHRDLCSDNILLDCKGETPVAKVCDFGMSRIIKSEGTSISLPAFGHRGYLPPEATDVDSSRFDSSFDIFAFGAIMVQIVRCLPTIKSRKERTYELDQINSAHPLKPIIEQCLLVNRDDRPSAIQLERKLT